MKDRDQKLVNYAKASGAFYAAANKYNANKTNANMLEATNWINDLLNRAYPEIENYCKVHAGEDGIDSLLAIAKADRDAMEKLFVSLK